MARLTRQQLRTMERRDKQNMKLATGSIIGLAVSLAMMLVAATWWLCVTVPVGFARWLTRTFGWRGWLVFGVGLVMLAVLGNFVGGH